MEQLKLFPKWLLLVPDMCFRDLERHILVCHFRDVRHEEHPRQEEDKYANGQVNPLDTLEGIDVVLGVSEKDERCQNGGNAGADAVERLGEIDPDFGVLWGTADCGSLSWGSNFSICYFIAAYLLDKGWRLFPAIPDPIR